MSERREARGWSVVVGGFLAQTVATGLLNSFMFGIFLKPIMAEFGWDRAAVSFAVTCWLLASGIGTIFFGALIDRYGVRKPTVVYLVVYCLLLMTTGVVPNSHSAFWALFALMGWFAGAGFLLPYGKAIAAWFDAKRGLALSLVMLGAGIGAILTPQYSSYFAGQYGWRGGFIGVGLVMAVFSIPPALFLLKYPPRLESRVAQPAPVDTLRFMKILKDCVRNRSFWLISISIFLISIAAMGLLAHLVPMMTDRGIGVAIAAAALSTAGLGSTAGRLVAGYCMDYIFAPYVAAASFLLTACGLVALTFPLPPTAMFLAAALVGFSIGAEGDILTFLTSRYFHFTRFGRICAILWISWTWGGAIGTYVLGLCYDLTKSYNIALGGCVGLSVLAAGVVAMLGPYVYPKGKAEDFIVVAEGVAARPLVS